MKRLAQRSPINTVKDLWPNVAPDWAKQTIPYMIKNSTLFIKAPSGTAALVQFREPELLAISKNIIGETCNINKIKVIAI